MHTIETMTHAQIVEFFVPDDGGTANKLALVGTKHTECAELCSWRRSDKNNSFSRLSRE